jgi:hypothetical protein
MADVYDLRDLPPDLLLARLKALLVRDHQLCADLLAHLAEVDGRKLYLDQACSSMFVYCVERLHMSEPTAYKRIEAARAARRFPVIFERVAAGDLTLTAVTLLAPRLTGDNHLDLLAAAVHRSKRELERLLAARFPKPDVAPELRKVPAPKSAAPVAGSSAPASSVSPPSPSPPPSPPPTPEMTAVPVPPPLAFTLSRPAPVAEVKPLTADRYYLKLTLSATVHDKLLAAQALLRHRIPSGDLDAVLERALDALLVDLRRGKFGDTAAPRATVPPPRSGSRHVPSAVKREVAARDGHQCSFVASDGHRCQERAFLELDHTTLFCRGGASDAASMRILCAAHNRHAAAQELGESFMERKISEARAGS